MDEGVGSWLRVNLVALVAEYANATTYFVHQDHLGSTRLLTSVGSDLISNPGFESGLTGWTILDGNVSLISNASNAHSGTNYIQISTNPGGSSDIMVSSPTPVQPGDVITFGGWAYLQSGGAGAEGWFMETQDSNHTAVGWIGAGTAASGASWAFQTSTYTIPSGVAYVALYATSYMPTTAAVVRVDDGFLYDGRTSLQIVQNLDYLPYGELLSSNSGATTHMFTGDERDAETNLDHTQFRKYSSNLGRWMTPDPAGLAAVDPTNPQSWNRYAYVTNSPLVLVDLFGLCGNGPSSATDNPDGSVTVVADAPCCPPGTTMRSIAIPLGSMLVCLGFDDTSDYVFWGINSAWSQGPGGGGGIGGLLQKALQLSCQSLQPPDVLTIGVGADLGTGIGGGEGIQLGIAGNGNSGQLGIIFTQNFDLGAEGPDAYVYSGTVPNAPNNSTLGGGFSGIANVTNHVNAGYGRGGVSYDLNSHSRTLTFGPSTFPFTLTFGTSRTGVLFNIPFLGYLLNPVSATCSAVGNKPNG